MLTRYERWRRVDTTIPEARRAREAGELWPENLTDDELRQEWLATGPENPISIRMLRSEIERREAIQKVKA